MGSAMEYLIYVTCIVCFCVFSGCQAVNIRDLNVPSLVELDGGEAIVLDCDYTLDNIKGLVVKWFFNKNNYPVYQWIPPHKPQDLGILKGKVDLGYKVSDDPFQSHRAIRILNPSAEMSGNYTCVVSTFLHEDRKTKAMLLFTPGKNFQLRQEKVDAASVKLVCFAEDVYPQPSIVITSQSSVIKDVKTEAMPGHAGLFDVVSTAIVKDSDVSDPEEFVCEMRVPQANYSTKKLALYYPGVMPTAQLAAASGGAFDDQGIGAGVDHATPNKKVLLIVLSALLYISSLLY